MKRSDISPMPVFFDRYIKLVDDIPLGDALKNNPWLADIEVRSLLHRLGDKVYASGKWTVRDIIQHVIDTERIMAYRALCIARKETTNLPGFDEEPYAANARANSRSLDDLLAEFSLVRQSSIALFSSFGADQLQTLGTANATRITPLALGFVISGHAVHHYNILCERYVPLLLT